MKNYNRFFCSLLGGALISTVSMSPAQAWDNDLTIYAWGAGITGKATLNGQTVPTGPTEVDFEDILEKLEMAFMGHYEGMADTWGFGVDLTSQQLAVVEFR